MAGHASKAARAMRVTAARYSVLAAVELNAEARQGGRLDQAVVAGRAVRAGPTCRVRR
jgi:L-serine deaminase